MFQSEDIWVFGYGSLMWHPGFDHCERAPALLRGYHRAFCLTSYRYRGTPEKPGLVLGLDRGGSCRGIAYRVAAERRDATLAYLHDREMVHYIYIPKALPVVLDDGRRVVAHTYTADPKHERYAGGLPVDELVQMVVQGHGERGACAEYLENTVRHLDELGINDGPLHDLLDRVAAVRGAV
ncbi:MAG: gamma-glutamylcyclotransferase [Alphaproteobacteria bacterium]|nr:gamma-glutamylcyclotransferase [Alphaproteobacteria bacterium]